MSDGSISLPYGDGEEKRIRVVGKPRRVSFHVDEKGKMKTKHCEGYTKALEKKMLRLVL